MEGRSPAESQGDGDHLPNTWADNNYCESSKWEEFTSGKSGQDCLRHKDETSHDHREQEKKKKKKKKPSQTKARQADRAGV